MQKTMKRTLALILAVMLCLSGLPYSAFAAEAPPDEPLSSQAPPSEAPAESSEPEPSAGPDVAPQPDLEATPGPENSPEPDAAAEPSPVPPAEASPSPAPSAQPDSPYETELAQVDATQIWSSLQRARTRAAAGAGTAGVLQMGYYCFKSDVGTLTTLGEYVSQMPAKTMLINGTNIAAYCLEHEKGATGGTPYTWTDLTVNAQDTVGTIMALGFQWNAADFWAGPSDNGDKWAVTQLLIWETINGHAFMQGDGLFGVEAAVDEDMEKCAPHAYNPTKFLEYYRDFKKRLNDYMKVPSFASKEPDQAKVITMKWDGSKYSATVTDSNAVLSKYKFENCLPGVKISASGNSLTLTSTAPILSPKLSSTVQSDDMLREIEYTQSGTDTKLFELNQSIAALNDKSLTLQKLSTKGFIGPDEFRIQSEALAAQRQRLTAQRNKKLHGLQSHSAMEKLEELQAILSSWPGVPTEFDIDQFDEIVEKIIPTADNKLTFRLHCGLELTEDIPS